MPIHITFTAAGGTDPTAWVSAGAAVVQAIGAIVAIVYAGKLARDASKREIAADRASALREADADARAVARIATADQAAEARRMEDARRRHNEPIDIALGLADQTIADMQSELQRFEKEVATNVQSTTRLRTIKAQNILADQRQVLIERATDAASAQAIGLMADALAPNPAGYYDQPIGWVSTLQFKLADARATVAALRNEIWP